MSASADRVAELGPGAGAHPADELVILVVCAGNQCRSPAIATAFGQGAGGRPGLDGRGVRVESAGTVDASGAPVDPRTVRALRRAGYEPPRTISRALTREMIQGADLVLTASRRHRTKVVRMVPEALRRTYTMREFARVCATFPVARVRDDASPAERLRAAMTWVEEHRGMVVPAQPDEDDIPDPAGRSRRTHVRTVQLVVDAVAPVLAIAFPEQPQGRRRWRVVS